ncbi:MAG TPA: hypothetical protein VFS67_03865 [Polyangiaceae bacterium]|nr:hypothetical protein [Polyangiaceae bacterium]
MNVNLLIDNIVRQTTVLVAQLAVIADRFGLTLRTYHDRLRRASESVTRLSVLGPGLGLERTFDVTRSARRAVGSSW